MQSLRIGLIAPPWVTTPPVGYGGTEYVVDGLARGLSAAGHTVKLWATTDSQCPVDLGAVAASTGARGIGTAHVEIRHVLAAYDWLRNEGVDVIHDHTLVGPLIGPDRSSVPVVTTNHGPFADPSLLALFRDVSERVAVIAISENQASAAKGVRLAATILHGLDVDALAPGDGSGGYLAFLGRMAPEKGVDLAIEIARGAGRPLLIAAKMADDREREYFERDIAPRLGGGIEFVGELDARAKHELLRGAAALLNPIRWAEPFGLVMIEALAAGTPVLAHAVGSAPEIVDHGVTGFLAQGPDGLAGWVDQVDRLDRASCRAAAVERFSFARMVSDHVQLYRRILSGQTTYRAGVGPVEPPLVGVPATPLNHLVAANEPARV